MAVKVKFNFKAFEEIRRDPRVLADLDQRADRVAAAAGPGFESGSGQGRSRARGSVWTTDRRSRRAAAGGDLVRALDAGR